MRNISSYRISRLLLSGDYICCDADNSLYLLAQAKEPPQLHNIQLQGILLPIEIVFAAEGAGLYCCFPLEASMTQCMGRVKGRAHMPVGANVHQLMLSLALTVMNAANDRTLRGQLLSCLHVANLWLSRNGVEVVWHQRTPPQKYSEERVVRRLAEMFYFLNFGRELTMKSVTGEAASTNELIEQMLNGELKLQSVFQHLAEKQIAIRTKRPTMAIDQRKPFHTKRNSIGQGRNFRTISGQGKRSIDKTELSLEKSIKLMREGATAHPKEGRRRLISSKKKSQGGGVPIAGILRYSQAIRPPTSIDVVQFSQSNPNSRKKMSIDCWAYARYSHYVPHHDREQQHTEAVSISSLVLSRARQAYEKEKKHTLNIDLTVDLLKHEQLVREHVSQEKDKVQELIATARKARYTEFAGKPETNEKERKAYNLINRSNRVIQSRLNRMPEDVPVEPMVKPQRPPSAKSLLKPPPSLPAHEKFESFSDHSDVQQKSVKHKQPQPVHTEVSKISDNNVRNKQPLEKIIKDAVQQETGASQMKPQQPPPSPVMIVEESREKLRQNSLSKLNEKPKIKPDRVIRQEEFDGIEQIAAYERVPTKNKQSPSATSIVQDKKKSPKQAKDIPPIPPPKANKRKEQFDDELEEITLEGKKPAPPPPPPQPARQPTPTPVATTTPKNQRLKSENSQSSEKLTTSISAAVDQYVAFINLMGEAVGKSQKATKTLHDIDWFTGVYYIYKRFFRERKKIEGWLEEGRNKFSRGGKLLDQVAFDKWLKSTHRTALLEKIKRDNVEIEKAINKMHHTVLKKNVSPRVVKHAALDRIGEEDSFLAMEYALNEVNDIVEMDDVSEELLAHMVEILDALFIIAELDGREGQRVNVLERRQLKSDNLVTYFDRQEKMSEQLRRSYGLV